MLTVDVRVERHGLWSVFHKHLIVELFTRLRDELGDDYWVDMESEILLVPRPGGGGPARPILQMIKVCASRANFTSNAQTRFGCGRQTGDAGVPDVDVTKLKDQHDSTVPVSAGVTPALLEVDEPIGEFEQSWIEIRRRDWSDPNDRLRSRVVGVVEVMSPSNKGVFGDRDLRKFLTKRRDYLLSTVSYVEVDLLLTGERDLPSAVDTVAEHALIAWSSQVRERSRHYWAWGWEQNDPLPTVVLPLDHPQLCSVDLGVCYQRAYESNRWASRLELVEQQQG